MSRQKSFKFTSEESVESPAVEKKAPGKKPTSMGKCFLCNGVFAKAAMTRHLAACRQAAATGKKMTPAFHLVVEGGYRGAYWLHVAVPVDATLAKVDSFLRHAWLECCGHMSMFLIDGAQYVSGGAADLDARSMNFAVSRLMDVGSQFRYEYDFGSTTELRMKVVGIRQMEVVRGAVSLLAQNDAPQIACDQCGEGSVATQTCSNCIWEGGGWLCGKCSRTHGCGEEMMLPVVNSPRVGVCAYTG